MSTVKKIKEDTPVSFNKALLALHSDIENMTKDKANPYFKSSYVPLPKMIETLKPIMQKHGFILSQPVLFINTQTGARNIVTSRITHAETGDVSESQLIIPEIEDMQKLGGAITYARRYTLSAVLGLVEEDDDGNTATGKKAVNTGKGKAKTKAVNLEEW